MNGVFAPDDPMTILIHSDRRFKDCGPSSAAITGVIMKYSVALVSCPVAHPRVPRLRLIHGVAFGLMILVAQQASAQTTTAAATDTVPSSDSTLKSGLVAHATPKDSDARFRSESFASFAKRTFGPVPLLRSTALSGVEQWRRQPVHRAQTSRGFRDRLDSRLGGEVLGHTIRFAFERVAHEAPEKYHACQCEGLERRLSHALLTPFRVATPNGERLSAVGPLGDLVSGLAVTSVQPGGFSPSRGLQSGAGGVASAALTSVVREFWPWHWRPPGL